MKPFNFFNRKQVVENNTHVARYSPEIEQIHKEFETAGERLLQEAKDILVKCSEKDEIKGIRLGTIGFTNVLQAKEVSGIKEKRENAEKIANIVNDYAIKYPMNKFITEEMVGEICKEYNLVCGDLSLYEGFVPEKNLKEIEEFKKTSKLPKVAKFEPYNNSKGFYYEPEIISIEKYKREDCEKYVSYCLNSNPLFIQRHVDYDGVHFFGDAVCNDGKIRSGRIEVLGLKICAPIKEMNTEGMELRGYHLKKHYPDPVVLQPIEGGYLIISAWGDEASDPIVVNPKQN